MASGASALTAVAPTAVAPVGATAVTVHVGAGALGLGVEVWTDPISTRRWVRVVSSSTAAGPIMVGDLISHINGIAMINQDLSFVQGVLAGTAMMQVRVVVLWRGATALTSTAASTAVATAQTSSTINTAPMLDRTATSARVKREPVDTTASQANNYRTSNSSNNHNNNNIENRQTSGNIMVEPMDTTAAPDRVSSLAHNHNNNNNRNKENEQTSGNAKAPPSGTTNGGRTTTKRSADRPKKPPLKKSKQDKTDQKRINQCELLPEILPEPGTICAQGLYYCTKNGETVQMVADKLGCSWKDLASEKLNRRWYGSLRSSTAFKPSTLLRIPEKRSRWKMKQLQDDRAELDEEEMEDCVKCGISSNPAELLLCDGCDDLHHCACVGLTAVPDGDWFCPQCLQILRARKAAGDLGRQPFCLPAVPPLKAIMTQEQCDLIVSLRVKYNEYLKNRRSLDLQAVVKRNLASKETFQQLIKDFESEIETTKTKIADTEQLKTTALRSAMRRFGVSHYRVRGGADDYILLEDGARIERRDAGWHGAYNRLNLVWQETQFVSHRRALKALEKDLKTAIENLDSAKIDLSDVDRNSRENEHRILLEYATLLEDPKLYFETVPQYNKRSAPPRYLGQITIGDDADVCAMHMLREPDKLILLVALDDTSNCDANSFEPHVGRKYGVFAAAALFDKERDDSMPMESNGVRAAQRTLFRLLANDDVNKGTGMVVTEPCLPPSVQLPADTDDNSQHRYFDLCELIRGLNGQLDDVPREATPQSMAALGHSLRDYQEISVCWLLDKENETTGLGLAGELWHRLRFLDPSGPQQADYFYCQLTGSFRVDIFDHEDDIQQKDASLNRFSMPTGGCLASEQGLGKTVTSIALILKNPPPLQRRVLPREHFWSKKHEVAHPEYYPLPNFGKNDSTAKSNCLSNGTLIIVPMTLLSQWQLELERFAPELSLMVLHNADKLGIEKIASKDVVIASTLAFQGSNFLPYLKKIHWHRILVDEAHNNQQSHSITKIIGTLWATHRHTITGTPLGSELGTSLPGHLRVLRLAPFDRFDFWKNAFQEPFKEHNLESLRVLRILLSHIICRHSKEQRHNNGDALLELPPRTVETVLLEFGSEPEQLLYDVLDQRNKVLLQKLKSVSTSSVEGDYPQLHGLLLASRQACSHASMVDLAKLDENNRRIEARTNNKRIGIRHLGLSEEAEKTRAGVLKLAVSRARPTAKSRMIEEVSSFQLQSGYLIDCPICLEATSELEVCLPACAHPICCECFLNILSSSSARSGPSGKCPTCRDDMLRAEATFLGDAVDAGNFTGRNDEKEENDEGDQAREQKKISPSFDTNASVDFASVPDAGTPRMALDETTETGIARLITENEAAFPTLENSFVSSHVRSERLVGTKVSRLLVEISEMMKKDPKSKCVVFSQWYEALNVAAAELQGLSIGFVRIDGYQKQHERADALLEFSSNPSMRVFLLSMRSGATGLTLTSADHCFILDVAQNSAIESQAIDRIHRVGQTRPCFVKRLVMKSTVEERILKFRRSLAVEKNGSASTGVSGSGIMDREENALHNPRERRGSNMKERIDKLEKLIGSVQVHRA